MSRAEAHAHRPIAHPSALRFSSSSSQGDSPPADGSATAAEMMSTSTALLILGRLTTWAICDLILHRTSPLQLPEGS